MKKIFLIIFTCLFCLSCGVKDNPEYKAKNIYYKNINLV